MPESQSLTSRWRELDRRFSGWSRRVFGPYDPLAGIVCWAWLLGLLYAGPSIGWAVAFAIYTFLWTLMLAPKRWLMRVRCGAAGAVTGVATNYGLHTAPFRGAVLGVAVGLALWVVARLILGGPSRAPHVEPTAPAA